MHRHSSPGDVERVLLIWMPQECVLISEGYGFEITQTWYTLCSAKFSRHTIFADHVVGSVSRKKFSLTKEILLATPLRGAQFNGA